MTNISFQNF